MIPNKRALFWQVGGLVLWLGSSLAAGPAAVRGKTHKPLKPPAQAPTHRVAQVPLLKSREHQLLIAVTINRETAATFLLDTGCANNMISATLAAQLQAQPDPMYQGLDWTINGYPGAWITKLPSLEWGKLRMLDSLAGVCDDRNFKINPDAEAENDGYFGAFMLHAAKMAVAVYPGAASSTFFYTGNLGAAERKEAGFDSQAKQVPLVWEPKGNRWLCWVTLTQGENRWTGWLELDTGSTTTIISIEAAATLGLKPKFIGSSFGRGGVTKTYYAPLDELTIGDLTVPHVAQVAFPATNEPFAELLGMDVLSNYNLLFDFAAGRMYLAPLEKPVAKVD